jgi:hypothetical protein
LGLPIKWIALKRWQRCSGQASYLLAKITFKVKLFRSVKNTGDALRGRMAKCGLIQGKKKAQDVVRQLG